MTEQAEASNNVVYMGDFLLKRREAAIEDRKRLVAIVEDLSNNAKDKFVAPVRAKLADVEARVERLTKHIKFIMRGGIDQRQNQEFTVPAPLSIKIPVPSVGPAGNDG